MPHKVTATVGGKEIHIESGKIAKQELVKSGNILFDRMQPVTPLSNLMKMGAGMA